MNINGIARQAQMFYALAVAEKLPENSKDLSTILKNIETLETYGARKKYAEKNLKRLSSGSSRIVFLTSDKTVVKLAKNDWGIAQNKAESNPKMKSAYLNKIIKKASNLSWIEAHYLEKMTVKDFKKITGIDFEDFGDAIRYGLKKVSGNSHKKPKNFDVVEKTDIYKEIKKLGEKWELLGGDLAKMSSWGVKNDHPVLIDAGLTKEVFDDFYESS